MENILDILKGIDLGDDLKTKFSAVAVGSAGIAVTLIGLGALVAAALAAGGALVVTVIGFALVILAKLLATLPA